MRRQRLRDQEKRHARKDHEDHDAGGFRQQGKDAVADSARQAGWLPVVSVVVVLMGMSSGSSGQGPGNRERGRPPGPRWAGQAALMPEIAGVICERSCSLSGADPAAWAAASWPSALVVYVRKPFTRSAWAWSGYLPHAIW